MARGKPMASKKSDARRPSRVAPQRTTVVQRLKIQLASAKARIAELGVENIRLGHSPHLLDWVTDILTPREWEVLRLFVENQNAKEIARLLGTSPSTVRHQLASIERKLGVDSRNALLVYVHAHGPFSR